MGIQQALGCCGMEHLEGPAVSIVDRIRRRNRCGGYKGLMVQLLVDIVAMTLDMGIKNSQDDLTVTSIWDY